MMELLLYENYTSRWSSKYLVRLPAVLVEHRDDLYNKSETTYCQISVMAPPGLSPTTYGRCVWHTRINHGPE